MGLPFYLFVLIVINHGADGVQLVNISPCRSNPEVCPENSFCLQNELDRCICNKGYATLQSSSVCSEAGGTLPGDPCNFDSNCVQPGARCVNGVCKCDILYIPGLLVELDEFRCLLKGGLGDPCEINDQCPSSSGVTCDPNTKKCACTGPDLVQVAGKNSTCYPKLKSLGQGPCGFNEQCPQSEGVICDPGSAKCACAVGFVQAPDNSACYSKVGLGDNCQINEQCPQSDGSVCDPSTKKCTCADGFEPAPVNPVCSAITITTTPAGCSTAIPTACPTATPCPTCPAAVECSTAILTTCPTADPCPTCPSVECNTFKSKIAANSFLGHIMRAILRGNNNI